MAKNENNVEVQYLTDDVIRDWAPDVLTEWRDFKLNYGGDRIVPYNNGLYDPQIFGSIYDRQCNCGTIKAKGVTCYACGAKVLDDVEKYKRFARIELPVYYCLDTKFPQLHEFIKESFSGGIVTDFTSGLFDKMVSRGVGKDWHMVFDMCQFSYDKENDALVATDNIDDAGRCSYEGLLSIFLKYKKPLQPKYSAFINAQLLVPPIAMRPIQKDYRSAKKLRIHDINYIYKAILWFSIKSMPELEAQAKSPASQALMRGVARIFIDKCMMKASQLMRTSKKNYARSIFDVRMPSSGRGTIIPSLDLKVDEVGLPRWLVYEACRKEFTQFIAEKYDCNEEQANFMYKSQARSEEVQKLFDEYIDGNPEEGRKGKYAMVSRAPVLFEYGISCSKIRLVDDYAMHLPIAICKPYNGDFDGDTMAWFVISDEFTDIAIERMSPRNRVFYKKNAVPLYMPEQDILSGLIIGTKKSIPKGKTIMDFDSVENAMEFREKNPDKLKFTTMITIHGKDTTIGRARLGQLFGVDLDDYLESYAGYAGHPAKPADHEGLTKDNIIPLYANLDGKEDRLERIRDIQNFAALITTIRGVTTLSIEELNSIPIKDSKHLERIRKLYDDESLTREERNVSIREEYAKFADDATKYLKDTNAEMVTKVTETAKSKIEQLLELVIPQINSDLNGDVKIGNSLLASGLSEKDFLALNIEQRGIQDIKQQQTPMSGYLTRQAVYLANRFIYTDKKSDPKNKGIWLPRNRAEGRMGLDGKRITRVGFDDTRPVMVRSFIMSNLKGDIVSSDFVAFPDKYRYKDGDKIGYSWGTQLTEELTQAALGLKHGGRLKNLSPECRFVAPFDCTLSIVDDEWIDLTSLDGKTTKRYPKPKNWARNHIESDYYPKGECLGYSYVLYAPQINLEDIIRLVHAQATDMPKWYERNKPLYNENYAISSGKVHYEWTAGGGLKMSIGGVDYKMNPGALCYFAEGDTVKTTKNAPPVKTAAGLVDMGYVLKAFPSSPDEVFYIFRDQLERLKPGINPEITEFLFKIIIDMSNRSKIDIGTFGRTIGNNSGIFTRLSFQRAKEAFQSIGPEGAKLGDDVMTWAVLPLILNGELI